MKRMGNPSEGELVVCKITKIYPNSAFARLVEYDRNGMIHVSEVASRWVRNIREFLKEEQYVVCRVMKVEGDHIHLSAKRVRKEEANSRLNEFKRERKARKLLELAAKSMKKSLDEADQEIGNRVREEFGSVSKAFEFSIKNPALMLEKGIPKDWIEAISAIAKKSYAEKTFQVKSELTLVCYDPNGVEIIKAALGKAAKEYELEVRYISAPKYMIIGKGKNYREIESRIEKASEAVVKEINSCKGDCSFKMIED